jgi:hypothetical protein
MNILNKPFLVTQVQKTDNAGIIKPDILCVAASPFIIKDNQSIFGLQRQAIALDSPKPSTVLMDLILVSSLTALIVTHGGKGSLYSAAASGVVMIAGHKICKRFNRPILVKAIKQLVSEITILS